MTTIDPAMAGPKGGRLFGGAASEEALASSRSVLRPHMGFRDRTVGLQQFFTPPEVAEFIARVFGDTEKASVFDPTAGDGALLRPYPEAQRFGCEVDRDHVEGAAYTAVAGDLQRVYPLLRIARVQFDLVVVNPPFGLDWTDTDGGRVNSAQLALRYAYALLRPGGQGALIAGRERFWREIAKTSAARHVYAELAVERMFPGVDLDCGVYFFAKPQELDPDADGAPDPDRARPPVARIVAPVGAIADAVSAAGARSDLVREVEAARHGHFHWRELPRYGCGSAGGAGAIEALAEVFGSVSREQERRARHSRRGEHDVSVAGGTVRVTLSSFGQIALHQRGVLDNVRRLNGQHVSYFALNLREWRTLERLAAEEVVSLSDELRAAVARALAGAELALVPLYPLSPQQRLGWLDRDGDGQETILCTRSDPERGFSEGERYPVQARSRVLRESGERVEEGRDGTFEVKRFTRRRKLLELTIGSEVFSEVAEDVMYLVDHFEIPDPGDVATRFPQVVARARKILDGVERRFGFGFRAFQKDDLSRILTKGCGLAAWEQGLGKSLGGMALAWGSHLMHGAPDLALFVVPQDLIAQWRREAAKFFGRELQVIASVEDAVRARRQIRAGARGWWITHYEMFSVTGRKVVDREPRAIVSPRDYYRLEDSRRRAVVKSGAVAGDLPPLCDERGRPVPGTVSLGAAPTTREACPACLAPADGQTGPGIARAEPGWSGVSCARCGHSERTLRTKAAGWWLRDAFRRGTVVLDEVSLVGSATGDLSLRTLGLMAVRARHRYGLSGTPLRNYVTEIHPTLWWLLREGESFPYSLMGSGRAKWVSDFCVTESIYSNKEGQENRVARERVLPQVTNLSVLWRLLAANVIRRRKEDTGEPIVPRLTHEIVTPPGVAQKAQSDAWLARFADFFCARYPDHRLVTESPDLVRKMAPALGQLWKLEFAATLPEADPDARWTGVSGISNWTPANLEVLRIALREVRAGRKVVIFSDLVDAGAWYAQHLRARGVRAEHITEERQGRRVTKGPKKRAAILERFNHGDTQVLCAGVKAIRLGHSLDQVEVAILGPGLEWSYEMHDQAIARVHRLTSRRPVDVFLVTTTGLLSQRKKNLVADKKATSDLIFDGRLVEEETKEIDWAEVVREMRAESLAASAQTVAEADVEAVWEEAAGDVAPVVGAPVCEKVAPAGQEALIEMAPVLALRPTPPPGLFPEWDLASIEDDDGQVELPIAC